MQLSETHDALKPCRIFMFLSESHALADHHHGTSSEGEEVWRWQVSRECAGFWMPHSVKSKTLCVFPSEGG